jgi:prepilin-type N-terminal cleavage/methylation domain-containing protein
MSRRPTGDDGFGLLETIVAVAIISVTMASLTLFLIRSTKATNLQADYQSATQLASVAMEDVSQFPGEALLAGRPHNAVAGQWQAPGVAPYLANTQLAWDHTMTDSQPSAEPAALPIAPTAITAKFQKTVYIGTCWQPRSGGDCGAVQQATQVEMFRVIVAVTWSSQDCQNAVCSYVTAMRAAHDLTDPTFG